MGPSHLSSCDNNSNQLLIVSPIIKVKGIWSGEKWKEFLLLDYYSWSQSLLITCCYIVSHKGQVVESSLRNIQHCFPSHQITQWPSFEILGSCWRLSYGSPCPEASKWYYISAGDQFWRPWPPRTWWQGRTRWPWAWWASKPWHQDWQGNFKTYSTLVSNLRDLSW